MKVFQGISVSKSKINPLSFKLPGLEGKPNVTALDIQIKKLRDSTLWSMLTAAEYLLQERPNITENMATIDDWLDKLNQLAVEVVTFSEPVKQLFFFFLGLSLASHNSLFCSNSTP